MTEGSGATTTGGRPEPASPGSTRSPAPLPPTLWQRTFSALRHRNYRLWFLGQLVSLVGTWMQITAQSFLVFQLTHSTAYLGFVGFANGLPSWLFMLYGGVVADRVARRTLLLLTQSTMLLLAAVLAGLAFTGVVQPWHVVLLAFALGTANAFDAPAGQAFVFDLVERADVTNAIALNASQFNLATVVGPTVAGLTYAAFGPAWCFALNGLSYVAVLGALLRMRLPHREPRARASSAVAQLREGVRYTLAHPILRSLIAIQAGTALFGMAYATLLPAWAVAVLGGNATTNGLLQSARGAGSLLGALMIAALAHHGRRGRWLTLGTFLFPAVVLVFAAVRTVPLALAVLVGVGWSSILLFNSANTLVQAHVADALRGRVMAIFSLTFFGGMPLCALWAGPLADGIGAPATLGVSGGLLLGLAVVYWVWAPQVRRLG
jgi:MFS family permease